MPSAASTSSVILMKANQPTRTADQTNQNRALAVANVTKRDELSVTSSRGPRRGDFGLKPEIAGPGTDIVAARAAGTFPEYAIGDRYARISGTSMASPHVAGAAAILAQQHPEWTGEQIKSVLIGSSRRLPGISTQAQGAGRLDIARGVAQQVRAEGVAGFGAVWGTAESTRKITYVNSGSTPVTLALDLDVDRANVLSVPRSVTVPAGGSAAVAVTARPSARRVTRSFTHRLPTSRSQSRSETSRARPT